LRLLSYEKEIFPVYQPLYRTGDYDFFGQEALTRTLSGEPPKVLFERARALGRERALDIICMEKALDSAPTKGILFINILPSTLCWLWKNSLKKKLALRLLRKIADSSAVLELIESENGSTADIAEAARGIRKEYGIRFSIDDMADGYNRLSLFINIKPEFVKLNRPFIEGCQHCEHKQAVLRAFASFEGCAAIAENVETEEELEVVKATGIPLAQGFIFNALKKSGEGGGYYQQGNLRL